jgi:hypothetical protein
MGLSVESKNTFLQGVLTAKSMIDVFRDFVPCGSSWNRSFRDDIFLRNICSNYQVHILFEQQPRCDICVMFRLDRVAYNTSLERIKMLYWGFHYSGLLSPLDDDHFRSKHMLRQTTIEIN